MKQLAVVMPVYNEADCIAQVVTEWYDTLDSLGIDFVMIVLDDGSRDTTGEVLTRFSNDQRIMVIRKQNSGHGPTILMGYHMAVDMAEWVFQTDSDNEMPAAYFPNLWVQRDQWDAVMGYRHGRCQGFGRRCISLVAGCTTGLLYGRAIKDVNAPYRLIRSHLLKSLIARIPDNTFAPNVIISGALAIMKARICNVPVPHENRRTGAVSIVKWRLVKAACRSFLQTLLCRYRMSGGK